MPGLLSASSVHHLQKKNSFSGQIQRASPFPKAGGTCSHFGEALLVWLQIAENPGGAGRGEECNPGEL